MELDSVGNPVIQFVAIKRSDNGEWALPGVCYSKTHVFLIPTNIT